MARTAITEVTVTLIGRNSPHLGHNLLVAQGVESQNGEKSSALKKAWVMRKRPRCTGDPYRHHHGTRAG